MKAGAFIVEIVLMEFRFIKKRDGTLESFTDEKIRNAILKALVASEEDVGNVELCATKLTNQVLRSVKSNVIRPEVMDVNTKTVFDCTVLEIEDYIPTVEEIQDVVEHVLWSTNLRKTARAYIEYRRNHKELRAVKQEILRGRNTRFDVNATKVLSERYLIKDDEKNWIETPEECMERVSEFIARGERNFPNGEENYHRYKKIFNDMLVNRIFLPNTPTLVNAGRDHASNLSACFVLPITGDVENIFNTLRYCALVFKEGGGVGINFGQIIDQKVKDVIKGDGIFNFDIEDSTLDIFTTLIAVMSKLYHREGDVIVNFGQIRPRGDIVKTTQGVASGPVSFMRLYDAGLRLLNEHSNAGCVLCTLPITHPDVEILIKDASKFHAIMPVIVVNEEFLQYSEKGLDWYLINPKNGVVQSTVNAKDLLNDILDAQDRVQKLHVVNESVLGCWLNLVDKCCEGIGEVHEVWSPSVIRTMHLFDTMIQEIKQGGVRRGAGMIILPVEHPNVLDFIRSKMPIELPTGGTVEPLQNVNISVGVTQDFVEAHRNARQWTLRDPVTGNVYEKIPASKIWRELVFGAWNTGDPGLIFLDKINDQNTNPHIGRIECTNPCGEMPLLAYESCNLGSINLSAFFKKRLGGCHDGWNIHIDLDKLGETVYNAVRFLDDVIEMNTYPIPEIERATLLTRKLGLGVMGWADLLFKLKLPYNSELACDLAFKLMSFVSNIAWDASMELARERGVYPAWEGSVFDPESEFFAGKEMRVRNSTVTTIAPTGSISTIAGCSFGIEPAFMLAYKKNVLDTQLVCESSVLRETLYDEGLYSNALLQNVTNNGGTLLGLSLPDEMKQVFVTAHQITSEDHLKMQESFQRATSNAISKTINLSHDATRPDVSRIFDLAAKSGVKGITVFRDKSKKKQVIESFENSDLVTIPAKPERCNNPDNPDCEGVLLFDGKCFRCSDCGYSSKCSL